MSQHKMSTCITETIRKPPLVKAQTTLKNKNKIMAKNDFQYGDWRMEFLHPAMSPNVAHHDTDFASDCTLQCGMWLWEHDSEFTKWQHLAM